MDVKLLIEVYCFTVIHSVVIRTGPCSVGLLLGEDAQYNPSPLQAPSLSLLKDF
jgi:hypothetical protein